MDVGDRIHKAKRYESPVLAAIDQLTMPNPAAEKFYMLAVDLTRSIRLTVPILFTFVIISMNCTVRNQHEGCIGTRLWYFGFLCAHYF